VLPVLQGILFLAIGLVILSRESRFARYWLLRLKRRYPKFGATFDAAERRAARLARRFSGRDS
jgi:hypothetical protein